MRVKRKTVQEEGIRVYYTNRRSIRKKIDLLKGKVSVRKFDIIAVTETWIDTISKNFLSEFEITGYQMLYKEVALFVKDSLT